MDSLDSLLTPSTLANGAQQPLLRVLCAADNALRCLPQGLASAVALEVRIFNRAAVPP